MLGRITSLFVLSFLKVSIACFAGIGQVSERVQQMAQCHDLLIIASQNIPGASSLISQKRFYPGEVILSFPNVETFGRPSFETVQVGPNTHIQEPLLAFLNHSCDPSARIDTKKLEVRARKDINIGDEINFFYPSTEILMAEPFSCACGAEDCVGRVAGAETLSSEQRRFWWPEFAPHVQRFFTSRRLSEPRFRVHFVPRDEDLVLAGSAH